jgi:hypothetical protein
MEMKSKNIMELVDWMNEPFKDKDTNSVNQNFRVQDRAETKFVRESDYIKLLEEIQKLRDDNYREAHKENTLHEAFIQVSLERNMYRSAWYKLVKDSTRFDHLHTIHKAENGFKLITLKEVPADIVPERELPTVIPECDCEISSAPAPKHLRIKEKDLKAIVVKMAQMDKKYYSVMFPIPNKGNFSTYDVLEVIFD